MYPSQILDFQNFSKYGKLKIQDLGNMKFQNSINNRIVEIMDFHYSTIIPLWNLHTHIHTYILMHVCEHTYIYTSEYT